MKQKTQGATTTDYVYDSENRLTQVKQGANILALYAYDDEGQRTKKTTGGATTNFVGDIYEGRSNSRTTHIYLDDGTRVASVTNRDVSYFHGDHLGSARLIADDLGNLVQRRVTNPSVNSRSKRDSSGRKEDSSRINTGTTNPASTTTTPATIIPKSPTS